VTFKPLSRNIRGNWEENKGKICKARDCTYSARAKGMCLYHYQRVKQGFKVEISEEKTKEDKYKPKSNKLVS